MMKSSALCHHPLTKKRWSPEHLVSVVLTPLHCEGKAFPWELSKYHSSASCCKDFLHGGRGVCARVRVCVCVHVRVCLCGRVKEEHERTVITVAFHGATDAPRQPLLALPPEDQPKQTSCRLLGICSLQVRNSQHPRPSRAFATSASPVTPP